MPPRMARALAVVALVVVLAVGCSSSDDLGIRGATGDPDGPCLTVEEDPIARFSQKAEVSPEGEVWLVDIADKVVVVDESGPTRVVVGCGERGFSGDGGPALEARLGAPSAVAFGDDGSVFVADTGNNRIRRVGPDGVIDAYAGSGPVGSGEGGFAGDGGPATEALLDAPRQMAVGPDGMLYFADTGNGRVRAVGPDGIITTIAGTGEEASDGDGGPAIDASLNAPVDVAVSEDGSLLIVEMHGHRVRRVDPNGVISTVVGGAHGDAPRGGFSGDGGPATAAALALPKQLVAMPDGSWLVADAANGRVRQFRIGGTIDTIAGSGPPGSSGRPSSSGGDGETATEAVFAGVGSIARTPDGTLWVDTDECEMRRIDPDDRVWAVDLC